MDGELTATEVLLIETEQVTVSNRSAAYEIYRDKINLKASSRAHAPAEG